MCVCVRKSGVWECVRGRVCVGDEEKENEVWTLGGVYREE